jgi:hypothetical protein
VINERFSLLNKAVEVFIMDPLARTVFLLCYEAEEGQKVFSLLSRDFTEPFNLIVISSIEWNKELSPYPMDPIFPGDPGYSGGGPAFLSLLEGELIPAIKEKYGLNPRSYAIAGYSLAGLFALYAGIKSTFFDAVISASGSLWFEGFVDYLKREGLSPSVRYADLSLGNKESNSKNAVLKTVEAKTRELYEHLKYLGIQVSLHMEEGGHFKDVEQRQAKAILRCLKQV